MEPPQELANYVGGGILAAVSLAIGGIVAKALFGGNVELKNDVKQILSKVNSFEVLLAVQGNEMMALRGALNGVSGRQDAQAKAHHDEREELSRRISMLEGRLSILEAERR